MKLLNLSPQTTFDDVYYNPAFMKVIEDNLTYLRSTGKVRPVALTNVQCAKYRGDFFGLLIDLQVSLQYHHMVMRVNNYLNPGDFTGEINAIIMPDFTVFEQMKSVFETA